MVRQFVPALVLAFCAAQLCIWLDTPLPWMIGPLFATAGACMLGAPLKAPVQMRYAGQWAIGTTLGLYFTAQVMATLAASAGWILLAVLFALALGLASGRLLQKLSGADPVTSFFAMAVGGASEMAAQGERHGALVERVAAAHSVRMMLVVATIPFAIRWWSRHGLGTSGVGAYPSMEAWNARVSARGAVVRHARAGEFEYHEVIPHSRLPDGVYGFGSSAGAVARRAVSSSSASAPPIASPRATMPATSESGICLRNSESTSAMTMNGMRYQNTGASESA